MSHLAIPVAIVAIVFGSLTIQRWLSLHYRTRILQGKSQIEARDAELAELRQMAERMQARIESLERLLDASQPEWRNKR